MWNSMVLWQCTPRGVETGETDLKEVGGRVGWRDGIDVQDIPNAIETRLKQVRAISNGIQEKYSEVDSGKGPVFDSEKELKMRLDECSKKIGVLREPRAGGSLRG